MLNCYASDPQRIEMAFQQPSHDNTQLGPGPSLTAMADVYAIEIMQWGYRMSWYAAGRRHEPRQDTTYADSR
ncbi:hypothetical protein [Pseudomonas putida]|uniref:hypothetical protein n=1 Tax=Pseudomonas putida TaxID=303 RepID=UPI000D3503EA|nr:hypothetical protein [Pseudomonas putida]PTV56816.1 hypothetical protein DBL03_20805 [Pseudomonas putida]